MKTTLSKDPTAQNVEEALKWLRSGQTPLVSLPLVCYRSGALADADAIDAVVEDAGGRTIWDGCHASGIIPLDGKLMVSCTYKYLNGGPGAPAFIVIPEELQGKLTPVIQGWMGQQNQFDMDWQYQPVPGMKRWASGTPPVLSLAAIEPGADMILEAGVDNIRQKSMVLTQFVIQLYRNHLQSEGFTLGTPEDPTRRGGHVALCHPEAYRICKAMIYEDVIPDFRPPNIIRLGLTPLDTRYVDAYDGIDILREIMRTEKYKRLTKERSRVT
ncbi:MAG: aminotransferase class V-fold PLP-dependent enzyme [Nanoarchaeota archaeon]